MNWTIVSPLRDRLAESPMWHPQEEALYWTDWYGPTIHRKHWRQDKVESWTIPNETVLGSFVFASGGRLLLAALLPCPGARLAGWRAPGPVLECQQLAQQLTGRPRLLLLL